jgi:chromosome segregation ATPase
MSIKDIVAGIDGLDEDTRAKIVAAAEAEKSAAAKAKDDAIKRSDALRARAQEAEAKMAELSEKVEAFETGQLGDLEKRDKQLEKQQSQIQQFTDELTKAQAAHTQAMRGHELDRIHGGINFNRDIIKHGDTLALLSLSTRRCSRG